MTIRTCNNTKPPAHPVKRSPGALTVVIGFLVAGNFALAKYVVTNGPSPFEVFYWQLLGASLVLLFILVAQGQTLSITPRHLKYYFIGGVLAVSGPQLVAYTVLEYIPAGLFTVLITLSPLLTFIIGSLYERKLLPLYKLVGISIGLIGISLATLSDLNIKGIHISWLMLATVTPLLLACGNIYRNKAYPKNSHPLSLAAGTLMFQVVLLSPVLFFTDGSYSPFNYIDNVATTLLIMSLLSAFSYVLTFELQKHTDGVGTSQIGYFVTMGGIMMGVWMFNEQVSMNMLTAVALIFVGLGITNGNLNDGSVFTVALRKRVLPILTVLRRRS